MKNKKANKSAIKTASFKIKLFVFTCISLALLIAGGIFYWWYTVERISVQNGRLNITGIFSSNQLKAYQISQDFLVDIPFSGGGYYTAIVPFDVQGGINLENMKIEQLPDSVSITMPAAQLLNTDEADDEHILVVREKNTELKFDVIKGYKIFGQEYAKKAALSNGLLENASANAEKLICQLFGIMFPTKKIEVTSIPPIHHQQQTLLTCDNSPFCFSVSKESLKDWSIEHNDLEMTQRMSHNCFVGCLNNDALQIQVRSLGLVNDLEKFVANISNGNFGTLFSSVSPDIKAYSVSSSNTNLAFYFTHEGIVYELCLIADSKQHIEKNINKVLTLCSGVTFSKKAPKDIDAYGITAGMWTGSNIIAKRMYISNVIRGYIFNNSKSNLINRRYKTSKNAADDGLTMLYSQSESTEKKAFDAITMTLNEITAIDCGYNSKADMTDDCFLVAYNNNKIHRDRFIFFMQDRIITYIPERKVYGHGQNKEINSIEYKKLDIFEGSIVSRDGKSLILNNCKTKEILSEDISSFLAWFFTPKNRTFFSLYSKN